MKLSKIEIINETVKFYSENPNLRGVAGHGPGKTTYCVYNGGNGKHCAVGRCLMLKFKKMGAELSNNVGPVCALAEDNGFSTLDEMLSSKYRGHEIRFWNNIQGLHDNNQYWDENGITDLGIKYKEQLIERYK